MQEDDMLTKMEEYFHVLPLGEKSLGLGKILSTDTSIKILEAVYNSDGKVGLSASEISEALEIGRTTVIYHLGRMQDAGLVKMNPVLGQKENWKKFWDLYKKRCADVSKEQFNRLHNARMNGTKLFVATKKGFLVVPSTDIDAGQTIVKEALVSITSPAVDRSYRKMAKTASVFGILGLLFIAFSFLSPGLSFLQIGGDEIKAPVFMEKAINAPASTMTMSPTMPARDSSESRMVEEQEKTMTEGYELSDGALLASEGEEEISNMTQLKNASITGGPNGP